MAGAIGSGSAPRALIAGTPARRFAAAEDASPEKPLLDGLSGKVEAPPEELQKRAFAKKRRAFRGEE